MFVVVCIIFAFLGPVTTNKLNRRSVNVALETVFEFGDHSNDIKFLDNVQSFISKLKTFISNRKASRKHFSNVTAVQKFSDFLPAAINILNRYNDEDLTMFFKIFNNEAQKYRYEDCKFSELMNDHEVRDYINKKLNFISQKPGDVIKKYLNGLKNESYDKYLRLAVDKINSFYGNDERKMLNDFLVNLESYNNRDKHIRNYVELKDIIRKGLQSLVFDHYSSLIRSKRMELKSLLDKYIKYNTGKIEIGDKTKHKNKNIEIETTTTDDVNYRNKKEKGYPVHQLLEAEIQNDSSEKQNGGSHKSIKGTTSDALTTKLYVDKQKETKLKPTHKFSGSFQSNDTKREKTSKKDETSDAIIITTTSTKKKTTSVKKTTTSMKAPYLTLYAESVTKNVEKDAKHRFNIVQETSHATTKATKKQSNDDITKKRFDVMIRNDEPQHRAQYKHGRHHKKEKIHRKHHHYLIEAQRETDDSHKKIIPVSIYKRTHRFGRYESDKVSDDDRPLSSEEKRILNKRIKKTGYRSGIKRNKSSKLKTKHRHGSQLALRRSNNYTNATTNEKLFIPLSLDFKPILFKNSTQVLNINNSLTTENTKITNLKHDLKNIRENDLNFLVSNKNKYENETEKYDDPNPFSNIKNIVQISEMKLKPDFNISLPIDKNMSVKFRSKLDEKINEIDHKEYSIENFNKTKEFTNVNKTENLIDIQESKNKSDTKDTGSELVNTVPKFRAEIENDDSEKEKDAQDLSEHSEEVKQLKGEISNNSSIIINFENKINISDLNETQTNEGKVTRNIFIELKQ